MSQSTDTRNSNVEIRLAFESDALRLARLRYDFRSSIDAPVENSEEFIQRCHRWMAERLDEDRSWRCWVAEIDQEIIGALWLMLIDKIPNPAAELEHHAYITNVYVLEDARGRGIGARLLSTALDWCRAALVHSVILWPTPESRSLYARYGFAKPAELMELILSNSSTEEHS